MKYVSAVFLMSFIIFSGCSDNSVTTNNNTSNTISGKIENWHSGNDKILKITASGSRYSMLLDSCAIDESGNFSFHKLTPADSLFQTFSMYDTLCYNNIVINPPGTRYSFINLYVCDSINELGTVLQSSDSINVPHTGLTQAYYFELDRQSSVNGTDSCNDNGTVSISVWNANFSIGWNTIFVNYDAYTPPDYFKATISTSQPKPVKWYFFNEYFGKRNVLIKKEIFQKRRN